MSQKKIVAFSKGGAERTTDSDIDIDIRVKRNKQYHARILLSIQSVCCLFCSLPWAVVELVVTLLIQISYRLYILKYKPKIFAKFTLD